MGLASRVLGLLPALVAGACAWTLAEYALHRVVFHELSHAALGASEHRKHHAEPDYFAPAWQKALAALAATGLVLPGLSLAAGPAIGASFTAGFIAMYLGYELLHRRCHTHPPRGAYGRWRRRNHFAHHFADPHRGHGVTTPVWDHAFGTALRVDRVRVPRRLAMRWLVDGEGRLRAPFAADYELVGGADRGAALRADERYDQRDPSRVPGPADAPGLSPRAGSAPPPSAPGRASRPRRSAAPARRPRSG